MVHSPWSIVYRSWLIVSSLSTIDHQQYAINHDPTMDYGPWTMPHQPKQKSRHEDGISLKQTKQSKRPSLVFL